MALRFDPVLSCTTRLLHGQSTPDAKLPSSMMSSVAWMPTQWMPYPRTCSVLEVSGKRNRQPLFWLLTIVSVGLVMIAQLRFILNVSADTLLPFSHTVIALKDSGVDEIGSPTKFLNQSHLSGRMFSSMRTSTDTRDQATQELEREESRVSADLAVEVDMSPSDLRRKNGDLSVYSYYFSCSGFPAMALFVACMAVWIFCSEFPTIWLKWWSEANVERPNSDVGMYMAVFAVIEFVGVGAISAACYVAFIHIISNSASKIHSDLLESTLRAPLWFFTITDVGNLTNRFSQDMELIDMNLPIIMVNYVSSKLFLTTISFESNHLREKHKSNAQTFECCFFAWPRQSFSPSSPST